MDIPRGLYPFEGKRLELATSRHYDIGTTRRDLGYAPRVTTAEGMERLAAWYRERESSSRGE